ncbi:MAG: class I SAM-dependent methyltransferase [Gammaproteobacteria bacterium]|nr:class I SAM-dependent methyltransferase [Gammaproteobacteria bacterium]
MSSRKDHWENIYRTKDHTEVSWYQESPQISLELFSKINALPSQSVIDVGCGASLLVDNLITHGYRDITLIDLSDKALSLIKSRLGDNADIPDYLSEDITSIKFNQSFDIWHDRAVFHFLTDASDRESYMTTLDKNLAVNGRAIIGAFSLNGPEKCSGLEIVQYDADKMKSVLAHDLELVDTITDTHVMPNGSTQEFMYFIIKHKAV